MTQDPIGLAGNNPTLYGYVGDTNWWIDPFGLRECRLNQEDRAAMGSAPDDMTNPHRHHIVRENAPVTWNAESQRHITESQRILREAGIDINRDLRNFTWAQNGARNHSMDAAEHVFNELSDVQDNIEEIENVLRRLGAMFQGGFNNR